MAVQSGLCRYLVGNPEDRFSHNEAKIQSSDLATLLSLQTDTEIESQFLYESRCEKTGFSGFLTRCDTNRAVQPREMARGLKFRK